MNIVLIGNPKTNGDTIKEIAAKFVDAGMNVRYPTVDELPTGEDVAIIETFERIDWADFVIAIPRDGLSLNYATTSEIAYAKHKHKAVFLYYE